VPSYCECNDDLLSLVGDANANAIDALPLGIGLEVEVGCEHLEILRFLRLAENQMQLGVSKVFTDLLGPFGYNGSLILNVSHQLCPFLMPYPPLGIFGMGSEVVLSKLSFWMFRGIEMLCLSSDGIDMNRHLLYSVMIIDDLIQLYSAESSHCSGHTCLSMHGAGAARSASLTMFESGCPSFSECRAGKSCST